MMKLFFFSGSDKIKQSFSHACMCVQFCDIDAWEKLAQIIEREKNVPSTYYQDVNMKCSNIAHTLHEKKIDSKSSKI